MARVPSLFSSGMTGFGGSDPFLSLHREMNRLFDDVMRGGALTPASSGTGSTLLAPHMDVTETDNALRVRAELPGVAEKDIELSLDDDMLTIRAEKKQERTEEREGVHISERSFGTFHRSLRLPFRAEPDQVTAQFENGVLTVTVPKVQRAEKSRRIQVQSGSTASGTPAGESTSTTPAASGGTSLG